MSTAEILSLVSLISYIVAGVCLVLALFFWFFFKIPTVIGDLSGRTAKKSIEKMRQANVHSGSKSYRSSTTNVARGKLTDTMPQRKEPEQPVVVNGRPETGVLAENRGEVQYSDETAPLNSEEETTTLLADNETVALNVEIPTASRSGGKKLTMLNEVMFIHTDEVI